MFSRYNTSISFTYDQGFISSRDSRQTMIDRIAPTQTSTPKICSSLSASFEICGEPNIASFVSDF